MLSPAGAAVGSIPQPVMEPVARATAAHRLGGDQNQLPAHECPLLEQLPDREP